MFDDAAAQWYSEVFPHVLRRMRIDVLSWEQVLARIDEFEPEAAESLWNFYRECHTYNLQAR